MNKISLKKEVDYYPEITSFFEEFLKADFNSAGKDNIQVYFVHSMTLPKGLKLIIKEHNLSITKLIDFSEKAPELFLDIFGVVTDGYNFKIVILEIKIGKPVGLTELSQLVGYSMVSTSTYGFLINVDGQTSSILKDILSTNSNITDIVTDYCGTIQHHYFNVMEWDSLSKNMRYTNFGDINTIDKLCEHLINDFEMEKITSLIDNEK